MGNESSAPNTSGSSAGATAAAANGNYPGAAAASTASSGRQSTASYPRQPGAPPPPPQPSSARFGPGGPSPGPPAARQGSTKGPDHGRPGAYTVAGAQHNRPANEAVPYTVVVPRGVRPGQQFPVMAGGVPMMVTCPPHVRPGDHIMVMVPRQQPRLPPTSQVYTTTVPEGIQPGGQFSVLINNRSVNVTCPPGVRPGTQIRIRLPETAPKAPAANNSTLHQTFEVTVPPGVRPGQPFALIANGQRVMVHCPYDARPGQKIRFQVPIQLSESELKAYSINYEQEGWVRCVGTDLKFHWARHDGAAPDGKPSDTVLGGPSVGSLGAKVEHLGSTFNVAGSAFVRRIGKDPETGRARVDLVRAEEVALDAAVPEISINFQHLSKMSSRPFQQKLAWFRTQCDGLRVPWEREHQHLRLRREVLLEDSLRAIESIRPAQMRERFRFEFIGEPGVDAGGVAREWFQLVSEQLFNPDFALFQYSSINQMCMQVNPSSGVANDEHLDFFHFAGRLLAKALFDAQLVSAHLVRPLYKHLLAWPIAFSDLEHVDKFRHDSLLKMVDMEDVSICGVDFTVSEERLGENTTVELVPDGEQISVTNQNLGEYMELVLKHRMVGRIEQQLLHFLQGFYEVIPEALLTIFDFQELELLMCGLPTIELDDWKQHTEYTGELESKGASHKVAKWFWEVLEEFESDQKARLLQFVTGTSGVPSQGFAVLQGNDGNIRKFTINGCGLEHGPFPRAHTCFNRIDLPMYASKADLKQYLSLAIQMECTGFGIE